MTDGAYAFIPRRPALAHLGVATIALLIAAPHAAAQGSGAPPNIAAQDIAIGRTAAPARVTARIVRPVAIRGGEVERRDDRLLLLRTRRCASPADAARRTCRETIIDLQ